MRRPTSRDLAIDLIARAVSYRLKDDSYDRSWINEGINPELVTYIRRDREDFTEMIQQAMDAGDLTLEDYYRILKNPEAYMLPREMHGTMPA